MSKTPGTAVVECGGVGYDVAIAVSTFSALPPEGAEVALHITTQVREDAIALFGFVSHDEKRLFERLITVSGVGPKLGIVILSGLPPTALTGAIRSSDHAQLVRIPGIGRKTAERIVLELKDKLDDLAAGPVPASDAALHAGPVADDVLSALTNLGYKREAAQKAIEAAISKYESAELTLRTDFDELFRRSMQVMR